MRLVSPMILTSCGEILSLWDAKWYRTDESWERDKEEWIANSFSKGSMRHFKGMREAQGCTESRARRALYWALSNSLATRTKVAAFPFSRADQEAARNQRLKFSQFTMQMDTYNCFYLHSSLPYFPWELFTFFQSISLSSSLLFFKNSENYTWEANCHTCWLGFFRIWSCLNMFLMSLTFFSKLSS